MSVLSMSTPNSNSNLTTLLWEKALHTRQCQMKAQHGSVYGPLSHQCVGMKLVLFGFWPSLFWGTQMLSWRQEDELLFYFNCGLSYDSDLEWFLHSLRCLDVVSHILLSPRIVTVLSLASLRASLHYRQGQYLVSVSHREGTLRVLVLIFPSFMRFHFLFSVSQPVQVRYNWSSLLKWISFLRIFLLSERCW